MSFNTQPPEGGCVAWQQYAAAIGVSTHSRPKAAARYRRHLPREMWFQHTAARRRLRTALDFFHAGLGVSIHSRPKAAAAGQRYFTPSQIVSTHSRPKAAALRASAARCAGLFQHTAARRRLPHAGVCGDAAPAGFNTQPPEGGCSKEKTMNITSNVSTHSRPKAAARRRIRRCRPSCGFNTQPPEGGCLHRARPPHRARVSTHSRPKAAAARHAHKAQVLPARFNTQPPEGGCFVKSSYLGAVWGFNTQPPEGGCR